MTAALRILVVCTANICRSPATVTIMRHRLPDHLGDVPLIVESAGVAAVDGYPACDLASALVGEYVARTYAGQPVPYHNGADPAADTRSHPRGGDGPEYRPSPWSAARSVETSTSPGPEAWPAATPARAPIAGPAHAARRATAAMIREADLVLALDRTHRTELARLVPAARPRIFTLRQAARFAQAVSASLTAGMLPPGAPPLPAAPAERFRWLVGELDAARGTTAAPAAPQAWDPAQRWDWHDDDVPDPHVLGYQIHPLAVASLQEAASLLCEVIVTVGGYQAAGVAETSV